MTHRDAGFTVSKAKYAKGMMAVRCEMVCEYATLLRILVQKIGRIVEMPELLGRERVTDALLETIEEIERSLAETRD